MALTVYEVSRKVRYARDGVTVIRTFDVTPYTTLTAFANQMLGGVRLVGGFLFRVLPARDPELRFCFCESVDVDEGIGAFLNPTAPSGIAVLNRAGYYDYAARCVCTYKSQVQGESALDAGAPEGQGGGDEQQEIEIATQSWDFSAQQLTLPTKYYNWYHSPSLIVGNTVANATKTFPRIDYALMRHYCVRLPAKAISELTGRINAAEFAVGGRAWPVQTMRFEGAAVSQKIQTNALPFFEITYKFAINPIVDTVATGAEVVDAAGNVTTPAPTAVTNVGWNRL